MAFNPPIPPPRSIDLAKGIKGRHFYVNDELDAYTKSVFKQPITSTNGLLDFHGEIINS